MSQLSKGDILDRVAKCESLRGINLVRAELSAIDLAGADLSEANLRMADLSHASLREAQLTGSFLSGAILNEALLIGANLVESSLIGVMLKSADLSRADLSGADLTGANLQEALLAGTYLVGTYLNETDLTGANLSGAYMRMAQMSGSNLSGAMLEGADLSFTDLSGARLDGCCLMGANLTGAKLVASALTDCDLRDADLTGADLSGCNLTGAMLRGIKFDRAKLDDAWADWVNLSNDAKGEDRAAFEDVFITIVGKPMAQVVIEGRVSDDVWVVILTHLCEFQIMNPNHSDVKLKTLQQGISSSALYLEAAHELSLAAYLAEFADIAGKGSVELFNKLAEAVAEYSGQPYKLEPLPASPPSLLGFAAQPAVDDASIPPFTTGPAVMSRIRALEQTAFWTSDKAIVILTGKREIWLEAVSGPSLTLRPPHGLNLGLDLIHGRFVVKDHHRNKSAMSTR